MDDSKSSSGLPEGQPNKSEALIEGEDFYMDPSTGLFVMTEAYLRKRGYCCGNGCRHCPYGSATTPDTD